jgi:tripartite ATP-independent transporter DctM subunit
MSTGALVTLFIGILIFYFIVSLPIGYALGLTSLTLMMLGIGMDVDPSIMILKMFRGLNSFTTLVIPFFFLAGALMNSGGMTNRIFNFTDTLVGRIRGGLGHVNILASMIFAGISGVAAADAAGLGPIEYNAMAERGYSKDFSVGITAVSTLIGPLIPPSLPLILYSLFSGVSAGGMLIAGLVPGMLLGLLLMIYVAVESYTKKYPYGEKFSFKRLFSQLKENGLTLGIPIILFLGIFTGWITVTEAAAVAVLYAFILVMFYYKELTFKQLWGIICECSLNSAASMILIGFAFVYGFLAIKSGLPFELAGALLKISHNPLIILLIINCFLLILGCFFETIAAISMLVPILIPAIKVVGIDPIHFGAVMILNLMVGLVTPPFGIVLFILSKVTDLPVERIIKAVIPFYFPLVICLICLTLFPEITLWLPKLVGLIH